MKTPQEACVAAVTSINQFDSLGESLPQSIPTIIERRESLLKLPEIIRRTGMCRAKIYRLEGFPKPIKLGRSSAWIER
jgi:predicted DNA-binding transcriptional regulator AlpA